MNREGFAAWTPSDAMLLEQLAMTGTLGRSFYASAREQTAAALELLDRAAPEALAAAVVRGRQEGFIRAFPVLGLVKLSMKSPELFQSVFEKVIVTGNDLGDFLDLVRRVRGLGRGVKRAIHRWLDCKLTPYYAMKYRTALADAVRLSRYRGEDPLCAFVLAAYSDVKGGAPEKLRAAEEKYLVLKARSGFIAALESGDTAAAAKLLADYGLDTDSLTAYSNRFDRNVWSAAAATAPVMKFLKYLAKYVREGVDAAALAEEKLTVENLRRAKVFPFRLYTAMAALEHLPEEAALKLRQQKNNLECAILPLRKQAEAVQRQLGSMDGAWRPQTIGDTLSLLPEFQSGGGEALSCEEEARLTRKRELEKQKCDLQRRLQELQTSIDGLQERMGEDVARVRRNATSVGAILTRLLDEYATRYDWAEFNRFSWVIAPDVSGSMSSRVADSALTFAELSAMFAGFFLKGLQNVRVLPWSTVVENYHVPAQAAVAAHIRAMRGMVGGGTDMGAPVYHLIDKRIEADFAVFLTDTEEYGRGWFAAWKRYRELFPRAQAFLLRADSYQSAPISEADAGRYGIWQIFGWNDSVIEYMRYVIKTVKTV